MYIGLPQGIYLALTAIGLLATAAMDGKPKAGQYNFSVTLCLTAISIGLLYWGGFFS